MRRQRWKAVPAFVVMVAVSLVLGLGDTRAQDDVAASCNGGTATGSANGGAAALGDINSGGNVGNVVSLGDTGGGTVGGGAVANSTDLTAALDGGTGISDASGGENCLAFTYTPPPPPPPAAADDGNDNDRDRDNGRDVDPFTVCLTIIGGPVICGAGSCTGDPAAATCTVEDCSGIGDLPSPCTFQDCEVQGNTGACQFGLA